MILFLLVAVGGNVCYMVYSQLATDAGDSNDCAACRALIGWFGERLLTFSRRSQNRCPSALLTEVFSGIRQGQLCGSERPDR